MATAAAKRRAHLTSFRTFESSSSVGDDSFSRAVKMYELYLERKKVNGQIPDPQILVDGFASSGLNNYLNHPKYGLDAQRIQASINNEVQMFENKNKEQTEAVGKYTNQLKNDIYIRTENTSIPDSTGVLEGLNDPVDIVNEITARLENTGSAISDMVNELIALGKPTDKLQKLLFDVKTLADEERTYANNLEQGNVPSADAMGYYLIQDENRSVVGATMLPLNSSFLDMQKEFKDHRAISDKYTVGQHNENIWGTVPVLLHSWEEEKDGEKVRVAGIGDKMWSTAEGELASTLTADNDLTKKYSRGAFDKNDFASKDEYGNNVFTLENKFQTMKPPSIGMATHSFAQSSALVGEDPTYYQMGEDGKLRELSDEVLSYVKNDPVLGKRLAEGAFIRRVSPDEIEAMSGGEADVLTLDMMKGIGTKLGVEHAEWEAAEAEKLAGAVESGFFGRLKAGEEEWRREEARKTAEVEVYGAPSSMETVKELGGRIGKGAVGAYELYSFKEPAKKAWSGAKWTAGAIAGGAKAAWGGAGKFFGSLGEKGRQQEEAQRLMVEEEKRKLR